jgi:hypothetical protein
MARIRTIKPALFTSRTVNNWPVGVRWTFAGLFTFLDDKGRGLDEARLVKAEVYPLDDKMTPKKVEEHLDLIAKEGPLCRYSVGGLRYMHIISWREHQRVNRPTPSKVPPCPNHEEEGSEA